MNAKEIKKAIENAKKNHEKLVQDYVDQYCVEHNWDTQYGTAVRMREIWRDANMPFSQKVALFTVVSYSGMLNDGIQHVYTDFLCGQYPVIERKLKKRNQILSMHEYTWVENDEPHLEQFLVDVFAGNCKEIK